MIKKNIVLFDMDGTLTEPREPFRKDLFEPLRKLSENSELGILTGSDQDYLFDQMNILIRFSELRFLTHLLPCNGTKHYKPPRLPDDTYKLVHKLDMQEHLGIGCFRQLMMLLCAHQEMMCYDGKIPLTGHFISYRDSMINWCPIGRNANQKQRNQFVEHDNSMSPTLRQRELDKISYKTNIRCAKKVIVKLGGETSFDIYPEGWDKTYALRHFPDHTCWFVGDRTGPSGNDKEIYDLLKKENRAFTTTGPEETKSIIMEINKRIRNE